MCREGCPTPGEHKTWGECLRAANIHVPTQESQHHGRGMSTRAWDGELAAYRDARSQGIRPSSTRLADTNAAVAVSRVADRAFDATTGGFAA